MKEAGVGEKVFDGFVFYVLFWKIIKLCRYKLYSRFSKIIVLKEYMNRLWKRIYRKKINCLWNDYVIFVYYKNGSNFFNISKFRIDDYLKINIYSKIIKNEILEIYLI